MSRKTFGIISVALAFIIHFLDLKFRPDENQPGMVQIEFYSDFIPWVILPCIIIWSGCATLRAKDLGLNSISLLRLLIPFYNLYFVFVLLLARKGFYVSFDHTKE